MLPKAAVFEDAKPKIKKSKEAGSVIGKIVYKYADRQIGGTDIEITGAKVSEFKFQKQKEDLKEEKVPEKKVVRINVKYIVLGVGVILLLAAIGIGIYYFVDNFYLIKYKMESRRQRRNSFKEMKVKRWRRRR